ncbi:MAG: hypothetical protein GYB65_22935 [Chloroflexi bacterium]|nr:hypothetical protein [Chloroflexota bacterium]
MTRALTADLLNRIIDNTVVVLLVRPEMLPEWDANLLMLMREVQQAGLDDEAIFLASVLALLHEPGDSLPTGTLYDHAWEQLLIGLQTGVAQSSSSNGEAMTLDQALGWVVEAVTAVLTREAEQKDMIQQGLVQMRQAAEDADIPELVAWLSHAMDVLEGKAPRDLSHLHEGVYAAYWNVLVQNLGED